MPTSPRPMSSTALCVLFLLLALLMPLSPAQSTTWSYCYYILGYKAGVTYTTSVSGSITTLPTSLTINNRTAYNVTGMSGTRVYSDSAGRSSSTAITGVYNLTSSGVQANFSSVDQLLYATWPYLDQDGLLYTFSGTAQTPYGAVSGSPVVQLWIDAVNPSYSELIARTRFNEQLQLSNGSTTSFDSTGGEMVVLNDSGAANTAGTISGQCAYTTSTSSSMSFCYYITNETSASSSTPSYSVLAYGTVQATGAVTRRGRSAVIAQSASGYRTLTVTTSPTSTLTTTSSITGVRGIDQDAASGYLYNNNAIYASAPYLDDEGLVFILNTSSVAYPSHTVNTTDVQIYHGDILQLYDEITPFTATFDYGYAMSNQSYFQTSTSMSPATLAAGKCQGLTTNGGSAVSSRKGAVVVVVGVLSVLSLWML